jgi:hypothetical protein
MVFNYLYLIISYVFLYFQALPWTARGEKGFGSSGSGLAVKSHSDGLKRKIFEKIEEETKDDDDLDEANMDKEAPKDMKEAESQIF